MSAKSDLLSFLNDNYDKLPEQVVNMSLLMAEYSSDFKITMCIYEMESMVGPTYS
jgi:hypothetical protein